MTGQGVLDHLLRYVEKCCVYGQAAPQSAWHSENDREIKAETMATTKWCRWIGARLARREGRPTTSNTAPKERRRRASDFGQVSSHRNRRRSRVPDFSFKSGAELAKLSFSRTRSSTSPMTRRRTV